MRQELNIGENEPFSTLSSEPSDLQLYQSVQETNGSTFLKRRQYYKMLANLYLYGEWEWYGDKNETKVITYISEKNS